MASIEERKNKAGRTTSYRVKWRDKNGQQLNQAVKDYDSALKWKRLLEQVGHDTKAATIALARSTSQSPTLHAVTEKHLELIIVRPYTITTYKGYVKNHLSPLLNLPVDTITEADLRQWVKYMQTKKLSAKTIANVHGFIYGVMETAIKLKHRPDNPCGGKYLPEDNAIEDTTTFLTMEEFNIVSEHLPAHNKTAFRFLISTGLRLGEMTALTVDDLLLDAEVPSVRVVKSYQEEYGQWVVGPPKTPEARRTVSLPPSVVVSLREYTKNHKYGDKLFTSRKKLATPSHRTWQRIWRNAVEAAQNQEENRIRKSPRIHDLRHSHASLMIAAGMNLFDLAKRLGHKSVNTTTQVYGHLMPGAHFKAASLMENILTAEPKKNLT